MTPGQHLVDQRGHVAVDGAGCEHVPGGSQHGVVDAVDVAGAKHTAEVSEGP